MQLDPYLITSCESKATGQHIHKIKNMIAAYRSAYNLALDCGDDYSVSLFLEAESQLINFLNQRKMEEAKDEYQSLD